MTNRADTGDEARSHAGGYGPATSRAVLTVPVDRVEAARLAGSPAAPSTSLWTEHVRCPHRDETPARPWSATGPTPSRVWRHYRRGEPVDTTQVAREALMLALRRFDPSGEAAWLRQADHRRPLRRHFRDAGWAIRVPRRVHDSRRRCATRPGAAPPRPSARLPGEATHRRRARVPRGHDRRGPSPPRRSTHRPGQRPSRPTRSRPPRLGLVGTNRTARASSGCRPRTAGCSRCTSSRSTPRPRSPAPGVSARWCPARSPRAVRQLRRHMLEAWPAEDALRAVRAVVGERPESPPGRQPDARISNRDRMTYGRRTCPTTPSPAIEMKSRWCTGCTRTSARRIPHQGRRRPPGHRWAGR